MSTKKNKILRKKTNKHGVITDTFGLQAYDPGMCEYSSINFIN